MIQTLIQLLVGLAMLGAPCAWASDAMRHPSDKAEFLLPFTYAFNRDLRPVLDEKLLITSANFGRMIRMPAGPAVGESAVSVHCNSDDQTNAQCHVTLTRATSNLDYVASENRRTGDGIQKARQVDVTRKDAPISAATAAAFRDCLREMIPSDGDHRLTGSVGLHDERIEFWLGNNESEAKAGEVYKQRGKRTKALVRIGTLLAKYCEAPESERATLAKQIETEAAVILGKKKKGEGGSP